MQLKFGDAERLGKRKQARRKIWTGWMRRRTIYFSAKSMLRLMSDLCGSQAQCHVPLLEKLRWIWSLQQCAAFVLFLLERHAWIGWTRNRPTGACDCN